MRKWGKVEKNGPFFKKACRVWNFNEWFLLNFSLIGLVLGGHDFVKWNWLFFNCYLADPQPTLGHFQGDSHTNPMLITAFLSNSTRSSLGAL